MGGILAQAVYQGQGGRNQSIFAEFSLPNRNDALIEIDVSNTQFQYFSDTKPASIQEPEDFRHNEMPQRRPRRRLERIDGLKKLSKLFVGQHSRHESRSDYEQQMWNRAHRRDGQARSKNWRIDE